MDSSCGVCGDDYTEKKTNGDLKGQCFRSTLVKNRDGNQCDNGPTGGTCQTKWAFHSDKYTEHGCWGSRNVDDCHSGGQDQLPVIDYGKYYCKPTQSIDRDDYTWQGKSWEICGDVNGCVNPSYCSVVDDNGKIVSPCAKNFDGKFDNNHVNGIWSTNGKGKSYTGCQQPCDGVADCGPNELCTANPDFIKTDPTTPNNYPNYCVGRDYPQ